MNPLSKTLSSYIELGENGSFLAGKDSMGQVGCIERFFRSLGYKVWLCESTAQKCISRSFTVLLDEMKLLPENSVPTQLFITHLRKDLDAVEVRDKLRTLANSPECKRDLQEIIKIATRLCRLHLKEGRVEECNEHYAKMSILGNSNLKLRANPARPVRSYPIREEVKTAYVNSLEEKYKGIARKAMDNIQHFTMDQLDTHLEICVGKLNDRLLELGMPSYAVGVSENKSSHWCAELASPHLNYAPTSGLSVDGGGVIIGVGAPTACWGNMKKMKEDVLVLLEDASYSGRQLNSYIQTFRLLVEKPLKIIVVVPFMSTYAYDILNRNIQYDQKEDAERGISVEIITSEVRVKALKEVFVPNSQERIDFGRHLSPSFIEIECGFAYCDWHFPDDTSFPGELGKVGTEDFLGEQRAVPIPYKMQA
ncbi:MAG: hypothetical protein WC222_03555 [Parachlamydiales bacterium]|jgi:hypothetical protein